MFQYESISARNGSATNSGVKRRAAENSETNSILKGEKRDMVIWSSKKRIHKRTLGVQQQELVALPPKSWLNQSVMDLG
jgi:hypothetical protein